MGDEEPSTGAGHDDPAAEPRTSGNRSAAGGARKLFAAVRGGLRRASSLGGHGWRWVERRPLVVWPLVGSVFMLLAVARFLWLGSYPTATSNDAGNWLQLSRFVLGDSALNFGHRNQFSFVAGVSVYNLGTPWLTVLPLVVLVQAFGPLTGTKVFMVLVSVAPGFALYVSLRLVGARAFPALVAGVALLSSYPFATIYAWANFDGLLGAASFLLFVGFASRFLHHSTRPNLVGVAISAGLVAGTDILWFATLVITLILFLGGLVLLRQFGMVRRIVPAYLLAGLACLPFLPTYLDVFLSLGTPVTAHYSLTSIFAAVIGAMQWTLLPYALWGVLLVLVVAFLGLPSYPVPERLLIGSTLLGCFIAALTLFAYHPARLWYLVPVPVFFASGFTLDRLLYPRVPSEEEIPAAEGTPPHWPAARRRRALAPPAWIAVAALIVVGLTVVDGYTYSAAALHFYEDLDAADLAAIDWVTTHTPTNATLVSSFASPSSPLLSFWIAGISGRQTIGELYADAPGIPDASFETELAREKLATLAFGGNLLVDNGLVLAGTTFPAASNFEPIISVNVGEYMRVAHVPLSGVTYDVRSVGGTRTFLASLADFSAVPTYSETTNASGVSLTCSLTKTAGTPANVSVREILPSGSSTLTIQLLFSIADGAAAVITGAVVPLAFLVPYVVSTSPGPAVGIRYQTQFGSWLDGSIAASSPDGLVTIRPANSSGPPTLLLNATAARPNGTLAVSFQVSLTGYATAGPSEFLTQSDVRASLGFSYYFVLLTNWWEVPIVSTFATRVYSNPEVAVYQV